jgi:hypothetical protein
MPKRKRANKAEHTGQVEREWEDHRRTYITGAKEYVYVCNVKGDLREWPRVGNTFKRVEVIGTRYKESNKLPGGFKEGDCFVRFGSGETMTISREPNSRLRRYIVREITSQELDDNAASFREVERKLRWRRKSYVMRRHE